MILFLCTLTQTALYTWGEYFIAMACSRSLGYVLSHFLVFFEQSQVI